MSGVPWERGCVPRELHHKEMDTFGSGNSREHERKCARRGEGKPPATSGGVVVKTALDQEAPSPPDQAGCNDEHAGFGGSGGLGGTGRRWE